jgi:MFS family permease
MIEATPARLTRGAFFLVFSISIVTAFGNTGMQSILPAIGRQIGMDDRLVVSIFSLSALIWGFSSPYWARRSDLVGRKPIMLVGLAGFAVSMVLCGLVVSAGLRHLLPVVVIFILFLFSRAIFGLIGSASNPAGQAYVAERTTREERTEQMAQLASAFGLGTVTGPFVAPLFVVPVLSLAGPMFAFALIACAMVVIVWRYLPESRSDPSARLSGMLPSPWLFVRRPAREVVRPSARAEKPPSLWRDRRLTPFLLFGFLAASAQTVNGQTLGFLIIDKLGLPPMRAQGFIAVAMGAGAMSGLLAQWGLIRLFRMQPRHLIRWGAGLAALANIGIAIAPSYAAVVCGYALASLGYGFCRPGYTAGASLSVRSAEQGRAAGAIAAINGSSVVVAPLLGVSLYKVFHPTPYLMNAMLLAGLLMFAFRSDLLRTIGSEPTSEEATTQAELERMEEGGGSL